MMKPTNLHQIITSQPGWLNTPRALTPDDVKGRIILLDFWTFCCINCMHVIPDLKYLEEKFGDKLTVIGIHSAKFKNEQDSENIRSAILRYGIEHPVANDFDFSIWKRMGVRAWPTFVLINPKGIIEETYSGEGHRAKLEKDIAVLIKKHDSELNTAALPIALEKDKMPASILSFPGKLALGVEGRGEEDALSALFVSDSSHHRIGAIALSTGGGWYDEQNNYTEARPGIKPGHVFLWIGSGKEGFKDGSFEEARFASPQGLLFKDGLLYVADTGNHALRLVDFKNRTVTTLAGTGKQGHERKVQDVPALATSLASPWDLAFYPDNKHIIIAMAGTHQLWSYDIEKKTVSVIAGNGAESIDDGTYPNNSLSQPSGLATHGGKLYFVDAETSSLRVLENGKITTLIGSGLFDFGFRDGKRGTALMQHAIGVHADDSGVYIADSYNHSIRRYDPASGMLTTYAGHGVRGNADGAAAQASFNEPNDLLKSSDVFYVADTNNNSIRIISSTSGAVSTLAVSEPLKTEAPAFDDALINLEKLPTMAVSGGGIAILFGLKKGWHINDDAPSYLALFDADKKPVASYDLAAIKKGLHTPRLFPGAPLRLQGTLYYCEEKAGAQCLIKSFDVPLMPGSGGKKELLLQLN